MRVRIVAVVASVVLLAVALPMARAEDDKGPGLTVEEGALRAALSCTADLGDTETDAVLFVPPTLADPHEAYFAYEEAFRLRRIPWCSVTIPRHTTIDIQTSAQYVVYAVRHMHGITGRDVDVFGWSQGAGPEPRWALRWWPDVRAMVDDHIGMAPPNHGTPIATAVCAPSCVPALWQQTDTSNFIAALNTERETWPGVDHTVIYSRFDGLVVPPDSSSPLDGASNVALQDLCPANKSDHLDFFNDPVAFALVIDALRHDGPADPARISGDVCTKPSMDEVPPTTAASYKAHVYNFIFADRMQREPKTTSEPPLRPYARR